MAAMPAWLGRGLITHYEAGVASVFLVEGDIGGLVRRISGGVLLRFAHDTCPLVEMGG